MLLDGENWYFFNDYKDKEPLKRALALRVRTFDDRRGYECFLLASAKVMNKLRYEKEVGGFAVHSSFNKPYPVYCASLLTSDIQHILDKYELQGIWLQTPTVKLTYS